MATKLFLCNTTANGITDTGDGILYDLLTSAGAASDTAVTNTSAGGTEIQATKTAGGSSIAWISGRAPSGGFTLTATDISLWQLESHMNANIGGRFRVFKRTAAGVVTELTGGPFDDGVEMGTANTEDLWSGNVTDTAFAEDDRILVRYYLTNVGTMASGHTGTLTFNAADETTGDSFFNIAETVTFKAEGTTVALTGVSATGAAGTSGASLTNALAGNETTGAAGPVSKVVEERFVFDTATDTNGTTLALHTPEIGGSLALHGSFTDTMSIQSNRVGKDGATGTSAYYYSATPPSLEYTIEIDIVDVGDVNRAMGLAGWIDTATDSMIVLRRQSSTTFQLLTLVNGTPSATLASTTVTFSAGLSRRLKLKRLSGDLFEASLDGTVFGSNISITDAAFQSPGKVGYRASNIHTATGYHVDNFSAYAIAAADPNVTLALTGVSATGSVGTLATSATPLAPSALVLTALSTREVMLVWTDNANDETSFRVERKTGAGGTYAEIGSTGKNIIAFYDATVAADTTYFYRVRARNAAGDSAYLTEQSVTTPLAASTVAIVAANLQHGQGTDSQFNYQRQVDAMAGADTVCVQERSTSDTGWDTPMSNAGLTQAIFKAHTGSAGDGNAIWVRSTVSVLQTYTFDMVQTSNNPTSGSPTLGWDGSTDVRRSLCAIKAQVGNKQFYVVSLHLVAASGEDSSNTNFSVQRVDQINSALSWAASTLTGLPRIIAGDLNLPPNYPRAPERTYTADASTDVITSTAHGFTDGMAVVLRTAGTQPAPLAVGDSLYAQATVYYVRDATIDTFKLAATRGGAAIDLTSNGTGSNFICATQWSLFWEAGYEDLWQEGLDNSKASAHWGDRDGNSTSDMPLHFQLTRTHDTRRIDYFMLSQSASDLTLRHVAMPDLRASCASALTSTGSFPECPEVSQLWDTPDDMGIRPSDHNFLTLALDVSPHVTLALTGLSTTSAVGSINQARDTALPGVAATTATGSLGTARTLIVSGVNCTLTPGSIAPSSSVAVSGVTITTAIGTVTPEVGSNNITLGLTGVSVTGGTGSVAGARSAELSGSTATVGTGTLSHERTAGVSGSSVSTAIGSLTSTPSFGLNGNQATGATGSLALEIAHGLSGFAVVGATGSVGVSTTITASGNMAAGAVGTLTVAGSPDVTLALTTVSASAAAGSLTLERSVTPNGVVVSGNAGVLEVVVVTTISGNEATGALDSLSTQTAISTSGTEGIGETGSLGVSRTIGISGDQVAGDVGLLNVLAAHGISGSESISAIGSLSVSQNTGLLGVVATATVGSVAIGADTSITVGLSGVFAVGAVGLFAPQSSMQLSGAQASFDLGVFGLSKSGSVEVAGVETIATAGNVGPTTSNAISGVSADSEAGVIEAAFVLQLSSVAADGLANSVTISSAIGITGVGATGHVGSFGDMSPGQVIKLKPETRTIMVLKESRTIKV